MCLLTAVEKLLRQVTLKCLHSTPTGSCVSWGAYPQMATLLGESWDLPGRSSSLGVLEPRLGASCAWLLPPPPPPPVPVSFPSLSPFLPSLYLLLSLSCSQWGEEILPPHTLVAIIFCLSTWINRPWTVDSETLNRNKAFSPSVICVRNIITVTPSLVAQLPHHWCDLSGYLSLPTSFTTPPPPRLPDFPNVSCARIPLGKFSHFMFLPSSLLPSDPKLLPGYKPPCTHAILRESQSTPQRPHLKFSYCCGRKLEQPSPSLAAFLFTTDTWKGKGYWGRQLRTKQRRWPSWHGTWWDCSTGDRICRRWSIAGACTPPRRRKPEAHRHHGPQARLTPAESTGAHSMGKC